MTRTIPTRRQVIAALAELWAEGKIDKFDFYYRTDRFPPKLIAEVADIPVDVVKDRRRYLRQLAKNNANEVAGWVNPRPTKRGG